MNNLEKDFLLSKLIKEYPNWKEFKFNLSLKNIYIKLCKLQKFKEIPKEIKYLKCLTHIDLDYNQISEIPKEIEQLQNLRELWLNENQISKIPA